MSHIHNLGSNSQAAAEYQQYLARLGARRRMRRGSESGESRGLKTFDSPIDPDDEAPRDGDQTPDQPEDQEEQPWSAKA